MWINEGHRPPHARELSVAEMVSAAQKASDTTIGVLSEGELSTTEYVAGFVEGGSPFNRQEYDYERNEHLLRLDRYLVTTDLESFDLLIQTGLPTTLGDNLLANNLSEEARELFITAKSNGLEPFIGLMAKRSSDNVPRQANWGVIPFMHPGYVPEGMSDEVFARKVQNTFSQVRQARLMRAGARARLG